MGKKATEEMIEKTMLSSDLVNGGRLNPEQQTAFKTLIRKYSTLLPLVRFVEMTNPTEEIDKLHVGEPITESAEENIDTGNLSKAKVNKITLTTKKVRSAWNITTETLQSNIEQGDFEGTVFDAMTQRISTDLETLAIQGDASAAGTDPVSRLIKRFDGWDKQTEACHILDAGGASIEKGIFAAARDKLPKQYRNDPGLRWIASDSLWTDWKDYLGDRGTPVGDAALSGSGVSPLGIPGIEVPLIPDDKAVTIAGASAAEVIGLQMGPFEIFDSGANQNNKLKIAIDGGAAVTITLLAGVFELVRIAKQINDALNAAYTTNKVYASDNTFGQIRLASATTGTGSIVDIQANATNAYATLGLTIATTTGANTNGVIRKGTFMLLCNPQNLIFAMLMGTRVYSEYRKENDRIETIIFNQVQCHIENNDAIVKVKNLRRREFF